MTKSWRQIDLFRTFFCLSCQIVSFKYIHSERVTNTWRMAKKTISYAKFIIKIFCSFWLVFSSCSLCCGVEVYKDKIEGAVDDSEKYGVEVRKAIRLSRHRVARMKKRIKKLSERKDKRVDYFHYPWASGVLNFELGNARDSIYFCIWKICWNKILNEMKQFQYSINLNIWIKCTIW